MKTNTTNVTGHKNTNYHIGIIKIIIIIMMNKNIKLKNCD